MIDFRNKQSLTPDILDEIKYHVNTRGYALVPNFLEINECDILSSILHQAVLNYRPQGTARSELDKNHLHDLLCNNLQVAKTLEDIRVQQIFEMFLGPNWIMYAHTSSSLPPQGSNFGSRVHVDSPRLIPGYPTNMGIIWALTDFTNENGATKVLPGSQHSDHVPSNDVFEANCVELTCKKGAIAIFNARLFHRAGVNLSQNWRHSLTMNVCRPFMKQRMDWVRFVPEAIAKELSPMARRLIGYDTRLPTNLNEFFVEEKNRLYKGGQE